MSLTNLNSLGRLGFNKGKPRSNGLSISAPASLTFDDADQPIAMYDFEQSNLVPYSGDMSELPGPNTATVTTSGIEDTSAAAAQYAGFVGAPYLTGMTVGVPYEMYLRFAKDALTPRSTLYGSVLAIEPGAGEGAEFQVFFDYADGSVSYTDAHNIPDYAVIDDDTTHWILRVGFTPELVGTVQLLIYPSYSSAATLPTTGTPATTPSLTYLMDGITMLGVRPQSSPAVPSTTTGTAVAPVASYGDIQLADNNDDGSGLYSPVFTISSGSMTVASGYETGGASALAYDVGDGTADATFTINSETLADINAALRGMTFDTGTTGADTLTVKLVRDSDGKSISRTINLTSEATLTAHAITVTDPGTVLLETSVAKTLNSGGTYNEAITFADADYDAGDDNYTVTGLALSSGTYTLASTAGLTGVGAEPASTQTFTGTKAAIEAALDGIVITAGSMTAGAGTLTGTIAHTNDGGSDTISVTVKAYAPAATSAIPDSTPIGAVIDTITLIADTSYAVLSSSEVLRPIVGGLNVIPSDDFALGYANVTCPDNGDDPDDRTGDLYWAVYTTEQDRSTMDIAAGTGATSFGNQPIANTGHGLEQQDTITITGLSASTTYWFYAFANLDGTMPDSKIPSGFSFTTTALVDAFLLESGTTDVFLLENGHRMLLE